MDGKTVGNGNCGCMENIVGNKGIYLERNAVDSGKF